MAIFVSTDSEHETPATANDELSQPASTAGCAGSAGIPAAIPGNPHPEKPPITNRGALITIPLENQFLIDWAAFTFKLCDPKEVVNIIGLKASLFTELERGIHGYRKSLRYGSIGIFFDGQPNMGCHVVMSGQGCRQYEGQFEVNPWFDLFTRSLSYNANFTRLDLAHDNVDCALDLSKLKDAIVKRHIRSRFRNASENKTFTFGRSELQSDDGHTLYFGKRSSRVFMRFYDKAAQMGTPLPWNRAEIELKDKRAQRAVGLLVTGLPVGQLFVGVMNEYLTIINLDDSNISRCTIQPWWSDWLQSTEKIRLTTSKAMKTVEEAMEYVKKQYSPTLAMIKEHLGAFSFNDYIREIVRTGADRMSMKHEQMLFLSAQRKADNYDQDHEDFEERAAIMEYDGGMDRQDAEEAARLLDQEDQK